MISILNSDVQNISSQGIPPAVIKANWITAKKEAESMGEGDNYSYIMEILRSLLELEESKFNHVMTRYLESEFLSSNHSDFNKFIQEMMTASSIPQSDIPEQPHSAEKKKEREREQKKDCGCKKESLDSFIARHRQMYEAEESSGVIQAFVEQIGLGEMEDDTDAYVFISRVQEMLKSQIADASPDKSEEDIDLFVDSFASMLYDYKTGNITPEDEEELATLITEVFTEQGTEQVPEEGEGEEQQESRRVKPNRLQEDILDQIKGIFGEAFGPVGAMFAPIGSWIGNVASDWWEEKKDKFGKAGEEEDFSSKLASGLDEKTNGKTEDKLKPGGVAVTDKKKWAAMDDEYNVQYFDSKPQAEGWLDSREEEMKTAREKEKDKHVKAKADWEKKNKKSRETAKKKFPKKTGKPEKKVDKKDKVSDTDEVSKKPAKDTEVSKGKKDFDFGDKEPQAGETPDEFKGRTGKCPEGYRWNAEEKTCVEKK